ncbi:hypothetical protein CFC21_104527 [Triticum aestivum]|uniref:Uncharacterized protein n=3 Tax=Triticum TaxID=4564 RepID=A0A9R1AAQ0_TRITD|nr:hypothetical protein CFC21_104527 [Triticum aestivum]VAI91435.1 unnamed protein product [Triticum turgidum subsp. durum]
MARMQNNTRALCFIALVVMATTVFSGYAAGRYIDTDLLCTPVEYCSPPVRASGNIACKANCVNRGYAKDKSSCQEGSSGTCCCGKN